MAEEEYSQIIAEQLDGVQPKMRDEPNAYKRAIIRMAIEAHIDNEEQIMASAFERHG